MVHSPVAFWKQFSPTVMGLWTDPTSNDGSFLRTTSLEIVDDHNHCFMIYLSLLETFSLHISVHIII